jgi:hypothetical protein
MSTRERCPACDLRFEREPGYFIGAMYASYAFGFVSTAYWFPLLLLGVSPVWVLVPPIVQLFAQIPVTYRYSRAIWLHVDRGFDPDGSCGAGSPSPGPRP